MKQQWRHILAGAALVALVILVAVGIYGTDRLEALSAQPAGVMSTTCSLQAVAPAGKLQQGHDLLSAAEAALRDAEARMSIFLDGSEISRFNQAPAEQVVPLSESVREVLALSRQLAIDTGGAFDVTLLPILQVWRGCAAEDRLPTVEELRAAREASDWDQIVLGEEGAIKLKASARVDLGGIAKGYAVDRAVEAMMAQGARGGLVAVGGDIRCFGQTARRQPWRVGVRDPFWPEAAEPLAVLQLQGGAVSTSGNYFRYVTIQGRRYSHIKDPRPGPNLGRSVEAAPSVTVVAPTAALADGWATALSVLGPDGLRLLKQAGEIKALMVVGTADHYQVLMSDGMESLLAEPLRPSASSAAPAATGAP